ncbi:MAG TPA: acyltransferase [Acidimicrobiales bacterium]|nr:acyltransferase [Acidimicrobiales bacterium]
MSDSPAAVPLSESTGRLENVDAMRPFSQAAVIATHALIFFAPLGVSMTVNSALLLTRFSRESFFFISALVLTYTYLEARPFNLGHFWKRRLILTGLPYLAWTIIYYVFISAKPVSNFPFYQPPFHYLISPSGLHEFLTLLVTGYYQLYFIVVLFEFYVIFPLLLAWLRRARRWHVHIMVGAMLWQIFYDESIRHHFFPVAIGGKLETRLILSYPIYLLGGMIVALNYRAFHRWMLRNAKVVLGLTVVAAALAVGLNYVTGSSFLTTNLAPNSDVLAPLAILYNAGAVLCLYLLGVYLVDRHSSARTRSLVASTSKASYGIYLSQMIWIPMLLRVSHRANLRAHVAWPFVVVAVVVVVFMLGYVFSEIVMRTPLGPFVVGRRAYWSASHGDVHSRGLG